MKKGDCVNYQDWRERADHDLEDAQRLLKNGGHTDTVCFHCQ